MHSEPTPAIGRSAAAVVFRWEGTAVPDGTSSAARLARRIESLSSLGVHAATVTGWRASEVARQLGARPPGPGRLLIAESNAARLFEVAERFFDVTDIGLFPFGSDAATDARVPGPAGSLRAVLTALASVGVGAGLVLIVGDEFGSGRPDPALMVPEAARAIGVSVGSDTVGVRGVDGAPAALRGLLDEQIRRRRTRRVPEVDADPAWIVRETGSDRAPRRAAEALLTLGAGGFGTRGSVEEGAPSPVLASGIYAGSGPEEHLLAGPSWTQLKVDPAPAADIRTLDLRTGVLLREEAHASGPPLRSLRFASLTRPGVMVLRTECAADRLTAGPALSGRRGAAGEPLVTGRQDGAYWAVAGADDRAGIGATAVQRSSRADGIRTVERMASYVADEHGRPDLAAAREVLDAAAATGFDRLLSEHRAAWAARWDRVGVEIPDDPTAELGLRFALFQLWCGTAARPDLAVGARGLSGPAYHGHVFWDADAFVLPALLTIDPEAAGAIVRYRLRRLPVAQARARALGRAGARFPWESAATGEEVTPTSGYVGGRPVAILTGELEEHITADVAWAAVRAAEWSGVRLSPSWDGFPLLVETARYWASRCRRDTDGSAHIDDVIGPDEYHESVDDNAFTNVMARWNLRCAADVAAHVAALDAEARSWRALADQLVDGYDPATRRYEQFAGYYDLEPVLFADVGRYPMAVDAVLGRERVSSSQLLKQPDVLMLHHLVPDEVAAGSLGPNLDFYGPRTTHGSSLSPSVTAGLLARAGRADEALELFRLALALDLDDLMGNTAEGLHAANLGGVWYAALAGFAGVRVAGSVLSVDPELPSRWSRLGLRFQALGRCVALQLTPESVEVTVDGPVQVSVAGSPPRWVSGRTTFPRADAEADSG